MKSNVSDYLEMVHAVYEDACAKCIADVSDLRDLITIRSRVKEEGISFLTISLPNFANDFEKSLRVGFIDSTDFQGFRKFGAIPAFLRGMLSLLFNCETGRIYDETETNYSKEAPVIVDCIRQVCLVLKKLELPCSPKRVATTLESFIAIEYELSKLSTPKADYDEFCRVSAMLWDGMLGDLRLDMLVPRHGPGATAERISGNQKYVWRVWHERLEPYFPIVDNGYSCSVIDSEELEQVTFISQDQEQPVRVTPVPKTLKAPRIIAIEPVCMQYAQQAIREALYERIESSPLTRGHVNFRDQSVNRELALISSKTGQFATIDLSDASDRVIWSLAREMFRYNPDLRDAIDACRSTKAEMPDGRVIGPLNKFASMGSALCFPVESMYFYTICVAALLKEHNLPVSYENVKNVSRNVYVYGDDLIVPSTNAIIVREYLQKYYCKVNSKKSFEAGKFRESCGIDAYDGEPVTPVYLRKKRPTNKQQASELISWTATGNLFYMKGYWRTARFMFAHVERILGPLPYVSIDSSALGRISFMGYRSAERWNEQIQSLEVRGWCPTPVYSSDSIDGYPALQKSILRLVASVPRGPGMDPQECLLARQKGFAPDVVDKQHLERTARHGAVVLRRRWVATL